MNKILKPKIDLSRLKSGLTYTEIQELISKLLETVSIHSIYKSGYPFSVVQQREDAELYSEDELKQIWHWLIFNNVEKLELSKISFPLSLKTKENLKYNLLRYGLDLMVTENGTKMTWLVRIPEMYSKDELKEIADWYDREIWHKWD